MKPVIGITCAWSVETWGDSLEGGGYYYVGRPYVEVISRYGGIPLLITPEYEEDINELINTILDKVQGLLFSGGGDARRFSSGQLPTLKEQQPKRYYFESQLLKAAWERKIPVIGICRGHQMIAEVFGGSIAKETVDGHKQNLPGYEPWHEIIVEKESKIYTIIGKEKWAVNSFHKQVIGKIPTGFKVVMKTSENIIEGIEACEHPFFMGFQFHPEELALKDETAQLIFKKFIDEAKKYKI